MSQPKISTETVPFDTVHSENSFLQEIFDDELRQMIDKACCKFKIYSRAFSCIGYFCIAPASTLPQLSSSVDVTDVTKDLDYSHSIKLAFDLEAEYKPRYKSDYHPQNGDIRSPRFVTDCFGHNFITLQVCDYKQ